MQILIDIMKPTHITSSVVTYGSLDMIVLWYTFTICIQVYYMWLHCLSCGLISCLELICLMYIFMVVIAIWFYIVCIVAIFLSWTVLTIILHFWRRFDHWIVIFVFIGCITSAFYVIHLTIFSVLCTFSHWMYKKIRFWKVYIPCIISFQ